MGKKTEKTAYFFLLPSLLGTAVFVLVPFLDVVRRSFFQAVGGRFTGWDNYVEVLSNTAFREALANTVRFFAICLPLLLGCSFLLAVAAYHLADKKRQQTMYLLPMAVPAAAVVVFWRILFSPEGMVNEWLSRFHINGRDWMDSAAAFWVLMLICLWKNVGYDMVLFLAGLSGIAPEQYEAARVSGAGGFRIFFYLTLPQMRGSICMIGVFSFINVFRIFREAYLLAGAYPHSSIYMLQHVFHNWFAGLDLQKLCAAAVLLAAVISLLFAVVQRWSERGEEGM